MHRIKLIFKPSLKVLEFKFVNKVYNVQMRIEKKKLTKEPDNTSSFYKGMLQNVISYN